MRQSSAITVSRLARFAGLLAFAGASAATADVVYVDASASGAGTGSNWTDAFPDLTSALAAAQTGDEIWVARGVYRPGLPGSDRHVTFQLKSGVMLYGGFLGGETSILGRDPLAQPTVLSGDLGVDDGPEFQSTSENCFRVVTAVGLGEGLILDGFVIEAGRADGSGGSGAFDSLDCGAAIAIEGSTLQMTDCVIRRNWNAGNGSVYDAGAGSAFFGCTFTQNHSETGGAGLLIHESAATELEGCEFSENSTPGDGAGVLCRSLAGVSVNDCDFVANTAHRGAGIFFAPGSAGELAACEFRLNSAYEGGGIAALQSSPSIDTCLFVQNSAELSGGGTFAESGSPSILHCTFVLNDAAEGHTEGLGGQGGSGGGGSWYRGGAGLVRDTCYASNRASLGAGLYVIEGNTARVENCMFQAGVANEAGGMYVLDSSPMIVDCLFTDNEASGSSFAVAGALSNYFSPAVVDGCVFERNRADVGGGGIYNEGDAPIIRRCIFRANEAFGLATGWGGGVLNGYNTAATIESCEFTANRAQLGGAIVDHFNSTSRVTNCTLVSNTAVQQGGAVYAHIGAAALYRNCVLYANTPDQIAGYQAVAAEWSLIAGGHPGTGNFTAQPGFARDAGPGEDTAWGTNDDDFGDLRPRMNSVLIDAGCSDVLSESSGADAALLPRFLNDQGTPDTGLSSALDRQPVDLGAYEFQGTSCLGDFDRDGVRGVPDIFAFLSAWFAGESDADADRSRSLAVPDIFVFLSAYFAGCP